MLIDGENSILGRLFTVVAKKALLGEKVEIINCEKIIISGKQEVVLGRYLSRKKMGVPKKGPFYSSAPEKFCKRVVRGMLPYKMDKGRDAFKRILFYRGVPSEFAGKTD